MRLSHTIILLLVIGLFWSIDSLANPITQEQFLKQLKDSHPLFEKEKLTPQIENAERNSLQGDQDWRVRSSMFFSHEEPAIAISGPEKSDALVFFGGVERRFWSTGGSLSASFTSTYASLEAEPFLGLPESYFQNGFTVTYTHPLLRNNKGKLDRLAYELKQFDIDISEIIALENEEQFLARAASRFLDWVLLTAQHEIITERLRLSEEELSRAREKREANLIDEVDVIRAEDAVRVARQNLLLVESQWNAVQSELAVLLQDTSLHHAAPVYDLYKTEGPFQLNQALSQLNSESRLLQTLSVRIDQLKKIRSGFREQGKADLSLVGQVGLKNAEIAFGNSLTMDKPDARIGLQLSFPVGKRTAKGKVAQTDLQIMQVEKQLDELSLELSSAVANVLTQASELESVLKLNQEQIESARRKTQEELKLYDRGRGELTFVIQSRDSEQTAKLTYALNALTYQKLLLEYRALMDQLHR
ncbi:MAG: TolC family protein [Candidatus Zixiibacteriota bacterium]|nr:MAG: TolC family protein [candidate division Zixibacteria bacterium]